MVSSFRNLSSYLPCRRRGACYGKIFRGKGRGLARVVPSFLGACRALRWITSDAGQPSTGRAQQPRLRAVGFHLIKAKWKDRRSVEAVPIWLRRRAQDSFEAPLQLTARKGECWEMRSLGVITAPRQGWDPQRAPPCQPCPPTSRAGQPGGLGITRAGGRGRSTRTWSSTKPPQLIQPGQGGGQDTPAGLFPHKHPPCSLQQQHRNPCPSRIVPTWGRPMGCPRLCPQPVGAGAGGELLVMESNALPIPGAPEPR